MKPLKQKISITLDGDVIQKLKELSEDCDRSLSQYINLVLKDYLLEKQNNEHSRSPKNET